MHCNNSAKRTALAAASPKLDYLFDQAAMAATIFHFLRQPKNSHRAEAGSPFRKG